MKKDGITLIRLFGILSVLAGVLLAEAGHTLILIMTDWNIFMAEPEICIPEALSYAAEVLLLAAVIPAVWTGCKSRFLKTRE